MQVTYDKPYFLPTPTYAPHRFLGWFTSLDEWIEEDDVEAIPQSGDCWPYASDLDLYAAWSQTFTLDVNGGDCYTESVEIGWGRQYDLPTPTHSSYTFLGWYLNNALVDLSGIWKYSSTGGTLYAQWGIVKGSYPQSLLKSPIIKSSLESQIDKNPTSSDAGTWISYKYYRNGSNTIDFMWYIDLTYDNEKYRGAYFTSNRQDRCGSSSTTRTSQYINLYRTGEIYWFKWEPIKWYILSKTDSDYFVVSQNILDSQQYYHQNSTATKRTRAPYDSSDTGTVYDNNYQYSDIRGFLNKDFYNTAFDYSQKDDILESVVDNSSSSTGIKPNNYACDNTVDKIFLLSYQEYYNYNLYCISPKATDYAKCQGYNTNNGFCLRSPGGNGGCCVMSINGQSILTTNQVEYINTGTRPGLHIGI